MKKLYAVIAALCFSGHAFGQCPATDSFSGSGALNSSNWNQTSAGGTSLLIQSSSTAVVTTASTQGLGVWIGSGCTPGADQYSQVIAGSLGGYSGPWVRATTPGNGYLWALDKGQVLTMAAFGGSPIISCPASTPGRTYRLVIKASLITGLENGILVCSGSDSTYATGNPALGVDSRASTDSLSSFQTGIPPLDAPTFSPAPGTFTLTQTVSLIPPAGALACGTTNGSTPTATTAGACTNGTAGPFTVSSTTTIKAISTQSGQTNSVVATGLYTIRPVQSYFIRADGGTRFSANVPTGQCDGLADVSYASTGGTGTNQHCAFNDVRYMWSDNFSSGNGQGTWIIASGDTVVIRGCTALGSQTNPDNPHCRIGYDNPNNGNFPNSWCPNVGNALCYNPPIPAGTAGAHTRILGGCAFGTYNCTPINNNYPYGTTNETQIFGGMALQSVFNLTSTSYVDIEGIELTTHNGACANQGSPAWPTACSTNVPLSDFAQNGFLTNSSTTNVLLQDVYIHGLEASGLWGPIGAGIVLNRVNMSFNASDAWNFDDGFDTANGTGATLDMTYVTAIGNGCHEQYPILTANRAFPAMSCYDGVSSSKGGDTLSGQDGQLARLTCGHCFMEYNTKDSWIGPHTQIGTHIITNSFSAANMGAQWKWGEAINGTILFQNNLTVTNCLRMSETIPGAVQNFNQATGLNGSYLTNFCRAGGAAFANVERAGAVNVYYGNTVIANGNIVFQTGCGFYTPPNVFNTETNCGPNGNILKDNNFLGYTNPNPILGQPSALYFPLNADQSTSNNPSNTGVSYTGFYNNEIGLKGGTTDTCGTNSITCVNPAMVSQPTTPWPGSETAFDVFNTSAGNSFFPTSGSPLLGSGTNITGMTTDFFGATRPSPPARGGAELSGAPTLVSIAVTPNPGAVNVSSTLAMTCTATFSDSSTAACISPVWTDTAAHSSINSSTGVVTGASVGADTVTATIGAISGNATVNVSAATAIGVKISGGVILNGVKFQ